MPTLEGHEALRAAAALARIGSVRLRAIRVLDPTMPQSSVERPS